MRSSAVLPDALIILSFVEPLNDSGFSISWTFITSSISVARCKCQQKWQSCTHAGIRNFNALLPLNFFISTISDDALTPGRYKLQLLSCVSIVVLHGRIDHFGKSIIIFMKMVKSFSIRNVERNVSVIRARTSSNYREWWEYRPLWSSIFFFAMSTRLSVIPNFLLQISWLWAVLDVVEVVVFHLPALVAIPRKRELLMLAEETRNATDILQKGRRDWVVKAFCCLQVVCPLVFAARSIWRKRGGIDSGFWVDLLWRIPIVRCLIISSQNSEIPIINRIGSPCAHRISIEISVFHFLLEPGYRSRARFQA